MTELENKTLVEQAIAYATLGWHVFPVGPDKKPHKGTSGFLDGTTDPEVIRALWDRFPGSDVAVACGASGVFVVDLDQCIESAKDGLLTWQEACATNGDDERQLVARTPSGGEHIFYSYPSPDFAARTNVCVLGKRSGVDVRGDGGYAVLPSSACSGRQWSEGDPFEDGPGDAPDWVLDIVRKQSGKIDNIDSLEEDTSRQWDWTEVLRDNEVAEIRDALSFVPNDEHDLWVRIGMALKSTAAKAQAFTLWVEWSKRDYDKFDMKECQYRWSTFHEFRWDGSEVTLGSLFHAAQEHGWHSQQELELPEPPIEEPSEDDDDVMFDIMGGQRPNTPEDWIVSRQPKFPMELLNAPGAIGDLANYIRCNASCDQPVLALGASIAAAASLMGRRVQTSTKLRSNIYICGVGPTGSGKEAPMKYAGEALKLIRAELLGPSQFTAPSGLHRELAERPCFTSFIDEYGMQLRAAAGNRADRNSIGLQKVIMELYGRADGTLSSVRYASKEDSMPDVQEPNYSFYATTTASELHEAIGGSDVDSGFLNRIIFMFTEETHTDPLHDDDFSEDFEERRRAIIKEARQAAARSMTAVYKGTSPEGSLVGATTDGSTGNPCATVYATMAVRKESAAKVKEVKAMMAQMHEDGSPFMGLYSRVCAGAMKLALIYAVCADPVSPKIDMEAWSWAWSLMKWSTNRLVWELQHTMSRSKNEEDVKRVYRIIRDTCQFGSNRMSATQLLRKTPDMGRKERDEAVSYLLESGAVRLAKVMAGKKKKGGRPTRYYSLVDRWATGKP